jgi:hypothetical protein
VSLRPRSISNSSRVVEVGPHYDRFPKKQIFTKGKTPQQNLEEEKSYDEEEVKLIFDEKGQGCVGNTLLWLSWGLTNPG